jgi:polyisoprenoid-binding protein YceI
MTTSTTPTPTRGSTGRAVTTQRTRWSIDTPHTDVLFSAKHMMVTTVRGTFADVGGFLMLDETNPTRSSGEITIAAASLGTGNGPRDAHLRSADFFDVETFPTIAFRSTGIEHLRGDRYRISGDLTIKESTRPVTFEATFLGFYASMQGGRKAGLSVRTTINRKDWGLGWNVALEAGGWLVGEDVTIEIEVAVDQVTESVATAA